MTYIFPHPEREPWIYPAIRIFIKNEPRNGVLVYGGRVYSDKELMPDTLAHEGVHVRQQRDKNAVLFALRYLFSKDFRLECELEAYREQYRFICDMEHDRNLRSQALLSMARDLSGPLYGNLISLDEATHLISTGTA